MDGEADVLKDRIEVVALDRRGGRGGANGLEVRSMKSEEGGARSSACTERTSAFRRSGRFAPNAATSAPNSARMRTQRSIEPSWFPQTPVNL